MGALKLTFLAVGTLAFVVVVYLSTQHPELVDSPGEKKPELDDNPLRKWDKTATWIMWGGWACAAALSYLDRTGYFDVAE